MKLRTKEGMRKREGETVWIRKCIQHLRAIDAIVNACCTMYRALNVSQKINAQYKISAGVTYN